MSSTNVIPPKRNFYMPAGFYPLLDVTLVFISFAIAYYIRYGLQIIRPVFDPNQAPFQPYLPYTAIFAAMLYINYRASGLYNNIRGRSYWDELYAVINGVTNSTVVLLGLYFLFQPLVFSRLMALYAAAICIVLL